MSNGAIVEEPSPILLVDDNPSNLQMLRDCLSHLGHKLLIAKDGPTALQIVHRARPALVLLDVIMPGMDGFSVCQQIKSDPETSQISVLFLTALDKIEHKVRGFQVGAVDFITKPFQAEEIVARVKTQLTIQGLQASIQAKNKALIKELSVARTLLKDAEERVEGALLGSSFAIHQLTANIQRAASSDANVLLAGPPGAGYEAIARRIHQLSPRKDSAFFQINCFSLQHDQAAELLLPSLESTDTFDGTTKFSLADGGTIYLEHLHKISFVLQQRLFQYFQKLRAQRAAGTGHLLPDVRLIAYAEDDLRRKAKEGVFLGPLIPHLSQAEIIAPPLNERREDIPEIAKFFLKQTTQSMGKIVDSLSPQTLENFQSYSWPGNIDELRNMLERHVAAQQGTELDIERSFFGKGPTMGGYRLEEKLGQGGMGEVWRAQHQLLAYPAAVKVIRQENQSPDRQSIMRKRFEREARITAYLQSPHTVKMYDYGVTPKGEYYYVMELLLGLELAQIVRQFGPLSPARFIALFRPICLSLAEAHNAGLVHRDLKPENIFICRLGLQYDFPKVLDFGIAKQEAPPDKQLTLQSKESVIGTPGFIAPEAMAPGGGQIDQRFDLYSLGCVAYWALTGQPVHPAKTAMQLMIAHVTKTPTLPSQQAPHPFPPGLDQLILDCLAKQPAQRIQSAYELYQRLGQIELTEEWSEDHAKEWWEKHAPAAVTTHVEIQQSSDSTDKINAMFRSS